MSLTPQQLLQTLPRLPTQPSEFVLALSGGLDSSVLLHLLVEVREQLPAPLRAVYIDHGLQADSAAWGEHCRALCGQLQVPFKSLRVDACAEPGQSPEEAARTARYAALAEELAAQGVLLTAQHQDDQAETLLLQLLRGAGPRGLAAMPLLNEFAAGWQWRPLLEFSRETIRAYAASQQLAWLEDPSNQDVSFARNFLRQQILPELRQRWPAMAATLSRSATACAELVEVADAYLRTDLQKLLRGDGALSVEGLLACESKKARQLLLAWLRQQGAPAPSRAQLLRVESDVLHAQVDAEPRVEWGGVQLRRYRQYLYVLPRVLPAIPSEQSWSWDGKEPLALPGGCLSAEQVRGEGVSLAAVHGKTMQVRFRRGGERIVLPGRQHSTSLKQAFQDAAIPPWQRERLPLLFIDEQLVAVAGLWTSQAFGAQADEDGLQIHWHMNN